MTGARSVLDRGDLRRRLAGGEVTYGTFVGAATPITAEVCAAAGVDWVLLDLEHGAGGEEQARDVIPAAASYAVPTVVRVESDERIRAGRILDQGAAGIMFPRIDTVEQAAACVRHLRYPPAGDRGVATYNRMCRFGLDPAALERSDTDVLGVVQIETRAALQAVEDIAALDGVDVLFVGPRDLSHALDVPGRTDAPAYLAALDRVLAAAEETGTAAGSLVPDGAAARRMAQAGWQFLAIGSDTTLLAAAVSAELRLARETP
jgi:2-dehydro-3-deoxyglucarate aldolase/4-hydroxy-2-oxoheptanedioate aldolase